MDKIITLIFICGILFAIAYFTWRSIQTTRFRKKAKKGDQCIVYIGDFKRIGMIRHRIAKQFTVEFYEDATNLITRNYHISEIYPVW